MSSRISAGLVLYRVRNGRLEVFLAHPGGPFHANRDEGSWSIPKGEIEPGEDYLATAIREVKEEVGIEIDPKAAFVELGSIKQKGGKTVHAWGVPCEWEDGTPIRSNTFALEWPPGSGRRREFPEVDRAQFFPLREAKQKIKDTQVPLLERLAEKLGVE
jgi:predicted NUDIX family NTP pyrophosphohydrolase